MHEHRTSVNVLKFQIHLLLSTTVNLEIFARISFLQIALKDILATLNTLLGHDLSISVTDRVIAPFRGDFVFTKVPICEILRK